MSETPFLAKLDTAHKTCGLFLFHYLDDLEKTNAFEIFNGDVFPWDLNPKLYGVSLEQHAYYFDRESKKKKTKDNASLEFLDDLCQRIETEFDVEIYGVYCNRFQDSSHNLAWHKDTYGSQIFVLSLGAQRRVEWRENKTKALDSVTPEAGDLYFMPLGLNKTHKHRVCAGEEGAGTRISLVFFFKPPKYAKEYKISFMDKVVGYVAYALE
jgi:hypothetical protein